jgi:hypothetical protein
MNAVCLPSISVLTWDKGIRFSEEIILLPHSTQTGSGAQIPTQRVWSVHDQSAAILRPLRDVLDLSPLELSYFPSDCDFLVVLFTEMLVTTFADDEHFGLDDFHQTGIVGNATVRRKNDASSAVMSIVLWASFRGLGII